MYEIISALPELYWKNGTNLVFLLAQIGVFAGGLIYSFVPRLKRDAAFGSCLLYTSRCV